MPRLRRFINIILTGMVVLVPRCGEGFAYPGYSIYIMALYDFYTMTMAIINLVKSRKQKSPVLKAAKVINVAAALIAMLSFLETAVIIQFDAEAGEMFRHTMISSTGGWICVIAAVMAVFMIARSTKNIRELKHQNDGRESMLWMRTARLLPTPTPPLNRKNSSPSEKSMQRLRKQRTRWSSCANWMQV